jgi:hypothetical protein
MEAVQPAKEDKDTAGMETNKTILLASLAMQSLEL